MYCRRHAARDLPQVSDFFPILRLFNTVLEIFSFVHPKEMHVSVHIQCIVIFVLRIMKKQSIGFMKPLQKKTGNIDFSLCKSVVISSLFLVNMIIYRVQFEYSMRATIRSLACIAGSCVGVGGP